VRAPWGALVLTLAAQAAGETRSELEARIRRATPEELVAYGRAAVSTMPIYRMHVAKRERIDGTVGAVQEIDALVREAPLAVRAEWAKGDMAGRKVLYDSTVRAHQMRAREAGILGWVGAVWIDTGSSLTRRDTRHAVTELPLSSALDQLQRNFDASRPLGGPKREDLGWDEHGHWCVRFTAPPGFVAYGRVIRLCFDVERRLPAEVEISDEQGLVESFAYSQVRPAPGAESELTARAAGL
jgi:hypothetical protein